MDAPVTPDSGEPPTPGPGEAWTPLLLTRWSGHYLVRKGVENGRLDAELLLARILGLERLDLYLQHDRPLLPRELESFKGLLKRRAAREPLQHILGTTAFRELELRTDARALVPRPETEVLVEEVLSWVRGEGSGLLEGGEGKGLTALDVGTGTGAIALSLAKEGPFRQIVATDPSPGALALARENAGIHGLEGRVEFREGPLFHPLDGEERFHVVASNPPYVPEEEKQELEPEVREYEPREALFAGPRGLDVLLPLVSGAPDHLVEGGLLAVEVGLGQAREVARAAEDTGRYREIRIRQDLAGRDRVVLGVA